MRQEAALQGGFFPIDEQVLPHIAALFTNPWPHQGRMADRTAGAGVALEQISSALHLHPYANELDASRARQCKAKFGPRHAMEGDCLTLVVTPGMFVLELNNPPYGPMPGGGKNYEYVITKVCTDDLQPGGYLLTVINAPLLSDDLAKWLSYYFDQNDTYTLDENYRGFGYHQLLIVSRRRAWREHPLRDEVVAQATAWRARVLDEATVLPNVRDAAGRYTLPDPWTFKRTPTFRQQAVSDEYRLIGARTLGPQALDKFARLFELPPQLDHVRFITSARDGHYVTLTAAGLSNGLVTRDPQTGLRLMVSSRVTNEEVLEESHHDPDTGQEREVYVTKPRVEIVTLDETGQVANITDDQTLNEFVGTHGASLAKYLAAKHPILYHFDYGTPEREQFIKAVRLHKFGAAHPLKAAQQHVVAAALRHFDDQQYLIVSGEPGTGKTLIGATIMLALHPTHNPDTLNYPVYHTLPDQHRMRPDQIALVTAPAHLVPKWRNEILAVDPTALVFTLKAGDAPLDTFVKIMDEASKPDNADRLKVLCVTGKMMSEGETWASALLLPENWKKEGLIHWNPVLRQVRRVRDGVERRSIWDDKTGWQQPSRRLPYGTKPSARILCDSVPISPVDGAPLVDRITDDEVKYLTLGDLLSQKRDYGVRARGQKKILFRGDTDRVKAAEKSWKETVLPEVQARLVRQQVPVEDQPFYIAAAREKHLRENRDLIIDARREVEGAHPEPVYLWQEQRSYSSPAKLLGLPRDEVRPVHRALALAIRREVEDQAVANGIDPSTLLPSVEYVIPFPDLLMRYFPADPDTPADLGVRAIAPQCFPPKNPKAPCTGLASFIARRYPGRVYLYVADEVHQAKNGMGSARGRAFGRLCQADKVLAMTGTLYGGMASDIYTLEYTLNPDIRKLYPWGSKGLERWIKDMGATRRVVETKMKMEKDGKTSDAVTIKGAPKEIPACSPLLLKLLLNHTIFLGLLDIDDMPTFEELPEEVAMDDTLYTAYRQLKGDLDKYLDKTKALGTSGSFMTTYFTTLLDWPNYPYKPREVIHRRKIKNEKTGLFETVEIKVCDTPVLPESYVTAKERRLIDLVADELRAGRGVGLFCRQTGGRYEVMGRLKHLIETCVPGTKIAILRSEEVEPSDREAWLDAHRDCPVIIANPKCVETGLDMVDWPTLIFYELDFSLFTMGQASRRAWRIIQTKACKVIFLYHYTGDKKDRTFEDRGVELMAKKAASAAVLYGLSSQLSAMLGVGSSNSLQAGILEAIQNDGGKAPDLRALFREAQRQQETERGDWNPGESLEHVCSEPEPQPVPELAAAPEPEPEVVLESVPAREEEFPAPPPEPALDPAPKPCLRNSKPRKPRPSLLDVPDERWETNAAAQKQERWTRLMETAALLRQGRA